LVEFALAVTVVGFVAGCNSIIFLATATFSLFVLGTAACNQFV
jgi:hypothetical protein